MEALRVLFHSAIFPGLLFSALMGLLMMGVRRKLRARLQGRVGPPLLQPLYDVAKLLCKKTLAPRCHSYTAYVLAPLLSLASACAAATLTPIGPYAPLRFAGDLIVVVVLLTASSLMVAIGGFASGNPYAVLGASRLVSMLLALELPLALVLASVALQTGTLSLAVLTRNPVPLGLLNPPALLAFAVYVMGKLWINPFSVPSAETEILEGPLVEYGGPRLALFELAHAVKTYVLASLLIDIFLPLGSLIGGLAGFAAHVLACLAVIAVFTLVETVVARLRLDQVLKLYAVYSGLLGVLGLLLALVWGGVL